MCRPSLVHPPEIRQLRDLCRYRRAWVEDRTREKQRAEKLLEDTQLGAHRPVRGLWAGAMMEALIAGQRDPNVLAQLARGRARVKTPQLVEALTGFFTDHHGSILAMMVDNIDRGAQIAERDLKVEEAIAPFDRRIMASTLGRRGPRSARTCA